MEIPEILAALEHYTGEFPREALEAAIARQEEITPYLLGIVREAAEHIERIEADASYTAHLYAFYLLAQFRERRAYPLLVEFFSLPGEITLDVTGDFVTESLAQVLASVSGGDLGPMQSLIEEPTVNEFVRGAAMDGMLTLVAEGVTSRETIIAYFRSLFRGGLKREFSFAWSNLVRCSTQLYPEELLPDIRQAFADDLVDEMYINLQLVECEMEKGEAALLAELRESPHYHFINDAIGEMEGWVAFQLPDYSQPVSKLLTLGDVREQREWLDHQALGFGPEHVPDLIRMALDTQLYYGGPEGNWGWAPIHAWRALGQLRAEEAVAPLTNLLPRIDEYDDDWVGEELPEVFGMIGPAAIPVLSSYLANEDHGLWARVAAAHGLFKIGEHYPETREACIVALRAVLQHFHHNDPTLNGFLISFLLDLDAVETASLMKQAFDAKAVDLLVVGDWEDVFIEGGLPDDWETSDPQLDPLSAPFESEIASETPKLQAEQRLREIGRNDPCWCGSGKNRDG